MIRTAIVLTLASLTIAPPAQSRPQRTPPPIIDMHLHASAADSAGPPPLGLCTHPIDMPMRDAGQSWPEVFMARLKTPPCANPVWSLKTDDELMRETIAVMRRRNMYGVLSGTIERVGTWRTAEPSRFIPGFGLNVGRPSPSAAEMREHFKAGRVALLAEVTNQYSGVTSNDARFEPYLAAAEAHDIPVGIHVGTGPVGAPYLAYPDYRASMHSALTLEEPLLRHPKLRVYVMHAGWPMLDDMLAVLYAHPHVYVETGVIDWNLPLAEFHRYLQRLVQAGFGKRVMFGSDQMVWPGVIDRAIHAINSAPFLTAAQKRDILYNNAARFLRLTGEQIARHHGR